MDQLFLDTGIQAIPSPEWLDPPLHPVEYNSFSSQHILPQIGNSFE